MSLLHLFLQLGCNPLRAGTFTPMESYWRERKSSMVVNRSVPHFSTASWKRTSTELTDTAILRNVCISMCPDQWGSHDWMVQLLGDERDTPGAGNMNLPPNGSANGWQAPLRSTKASESWPRIYVYIKSALTSRGLQILNLLDLVRGSFFVCLVGFLFWVFCLFVCLFYCGVKGGQQNKTKTNPRHFAWGTEAKVTTSDFRRYSLLLSDSSIRNSINGTSIWNKISWSRAEIFRLQPIITELQRLS